MAYRNGTYIAFHADGTNKVGESDLKYYNLIKGWSANPQDDFTFINSHEKTSAVRDSSKAETLRKSILQRLANSKNMLLIIGKTTKNDTDWVPFEIEKAVDKYKIPIIIAYTRFKNLRYPATKSDLWPKALKDRIKDKTVDAIHIPFKKDAILDAINQFDLSNKIGSSLSKYSDETQKNWGYL